MVRPAVDAASVLKKVTTFADLSENELELMAQRAVPKRIAGGETLFNEGDPCSGFYVIAEGRVRIFKTSPAGREQVLAIDGPGSSVAELPVFDGGKYPASCAAVEDSVLLFISKQDFQSLCLKHPEVALKVLRVIGRRLRGLVGIIEELSFATVRHRLAALLVRHAKQGEKTVQGWRFTLEMNNQELAAQIGTVRELVSRNLSRLQSEGLIEMDGRNFVVRDLKALEAELRAD
jgi:CRP-like cAMP-binding protein